MKADELTGLDEYRYNGKQEYLKNQLIRLVKSHKENCHNHDCNISLFAFLDIAKQAGIYHLLTDEEIGLFC